jgi:1-acyl-sn-glycerol-3-phosphate acyltransferase
MLVDIVLILSVAACVLIPAMFGLNWLWAGPLTFVCCFAGLGLLSVGFLWLACQCIDTEKPRKEDSPFYRWLAGVYVAALIRLLRVRITAEGLEKTPREGRFLLVCNHISVADPGIVLHCFKKSQLAFISKKENRSLFVVGKIMHAMLCQCIDRENDRAALKTILECIRIVKEDQASIAVFPEGGTNHDNRLHAFRPGVFKIAEKCQIPIVVCTIQGTRDIFRNFLRLKATPVRLRLVSVMEPEEFSGLKTTEISRKVWELMRDNLDEAYQPLE